MGISTQLPSKRIIHATAPRAGEQVSRLAVEAIFEQEFALDFSFNKPGLELDSQFRLFLSSKPDGNFPLELLQLGLKVRSLLSWMVSSIAD